MPLHSERRGGWAVSRLQSREAGLASLRPRPQLRLPPLQLCSLAFTCQLIGRACGNQPCAQPHEDEDRAQDTAVELLGGRGTKRKDRTGSLSLAVNPTSLLWLKGRQKWWDKSRQTERPGQGSRPQVWRKGQNQEKAKWPRCLASVLLIPGKVHFLGTRK